MNTPSRVLDDTQRTAGLHGAGYPLHIGSETFYLSRLTKQLRGKFAAWALEGALLVLREMAALYPREDYAAAVARHHKQRENLEWAWGGDRCQEVMVSHSGGAKLVQLLLEQHHGEVEDDFVEWLLSQWVCQSCGWHGVRPEDEAGYSCYYCKALKLDDDETANVEKPPAPKCCKRQLWQPYFLCPQCSAVIESMRNGQIASGIRELSSADPRMPLREAGACANVAVSPSACAG